MVHKRTSRDYCVSWCRGWGPSGVEERVTANEKQLAAASVGAMIHPLGIALPKSHSSSLSLALASSSQQCFVPHPEDICPDPPYLSPRTGRRNPKPGLLPFLVGASLKMPVPRTQFELQGAHRAQDMRSSSHILSLTDE